MTHGHYHHHHREDLRVTAVRIFNNIDQDQQVAQAFPFEKVTHIHNIITHKIQINFISSLIAES